MGGREEESGFLSYLKFWQLSIRINRAFHARKIRKELAQLHTKVLVVLESQLSAAKKEAELVIPLRQLSNDVQELLPELSKKIVSYRKAATDLYPTRNAELNGDNNILIVREKWGKIDFELSKIIHYNFNGLVVNLVIVIGMLMAMGEAFIQWCFK